MTITDQDREAARDALVKGYEGCARRVDRRPIGFCQCNLAQMGCCKSEVEAVAGAIANARTARAQGIAIPLVLGFATGITVLFGLATIVRIILDNQ